MVVARSTIAYGTSAVVWYCGIVVLWYCGIVVLWYIVVVVVVCVCGASAVRLRPSVV